MSLRKAINAKCKQCAYDPLAGGTWRQQVGWCTIEICPLWPVRPRSSGGPTHDPNAVEIVQQEGKYGPYSVLKEGS